MIPFLLILALTASAHAERLVALAWDPQPVTNAQGYLVHREGDSGKILLATVETNAVVVELPDSEQTVTVTAFYGGRESLPSLPLRIDAVAVPSVPVTRYQVTLTLQSGSDLLGWENRSIQFFAETDPRRFYRLKIETTPITLTTP